MSAGYPTLELVKKEIEAEINGYIHAITLFSSLREYLRNRKIECYIEPVIKKKGGGFNTPDLLVKSNNYLIIDHKYTQSKDERTLTSKIKEMKKYDKLFIFVDDNSGKELPIKPEVVMLTPEKSAALFDSLLNCPITWGYLIEENIEIKQSIKNVQDDAISSLFNPTLICQQSRELTKYRFILSHAPLPYTACHVYNILWNLIPPNQLLAKEFQVKYENILDVFNTFFPPWLRPEIKQMNVSRLDDALNFLQSIGWINWVKQEKTVVVDKAKGRMLSDLFSFLIDKFVEDEHHRRVLEYEKKLNAKFLQKKSAKQSEISKFF